MPSIASLDLTDVIALGARLRAVGSAARSMEEAAGQMASCLYDELTERDGARSCALVRIYVTQRYDQLDPELQAFAARLLEAAGAEGGAPPGDMRCLVLVATRGAEPAWNVRRLSAGHQAIPLPDEAFVARLPMVAEMFRQFGLRPGALVSPPAELASELQRRQCTVFAIPEAAGSPFVPAQDEFVRKLPIRSAAAFGGMLPAGELFATVLFSRVPVPREAAEAFMPLSLSVKLGMLPYSGERIFPA